MPYIGSVPSASFTSLAKQDITGNGGTDYTLSNAVTNANDLAVFLNNVRQEPTEAYTASGTTLSMTGAIQSSDNFYVIFLGQAIQTSNPPDGSVGTSQIANDSITSAKTNFVSTSSVAGLQIKGDGTTDGTLQLNCSQNSHGIKLKSPNHGAGQSYTLTFPPTAPQANKILITDASGNLSFADTPSSSMTPAFAATPDPAVSNQSLSASTWTKVTMGTVLLDTDNMFANSRFTPTVAGKYYCYFEGVGTSGTTHFYVAIRKNNSTWVMNVHDGSQTGSGFCGGIIDFNGTSDYVEPWIYAGTGTTSVQRANYYNTFGAFRILE